MSSIHHIARPNTKIHYSYHWKALCGAKDAAMYNLYPQYADVGHKKHLCQDCLDHPDYALLLLSGYYDL
jgi:hypothetical protein